MKLKIKCLSKEMANLALCLQNWPTSGVCEIEWSMTDGLSCSEERQRPRGISQGEIVASDNSQKQFEPDQMAQKLSEVARLSIGSIGQI